MSAICYAQVEYDENGKPIIAPVKTTLKLSKEPQINETIEAILSITAEADFKWMKVSFDMNDGLKMVGGNQIAEIGPVKKGNKKIIRISIKPVSSYFSMMSEVRGSWVKENGKIQPWGAPVKNNIRRIVIDSQTGQMGTIEEYNQHPSRKILMYYNHLDGEWMKEPDQGYEITNRKIAEEMRKYEPALSDSEALCLHADNMKLIINAVGSRKATDEERIRKLLKAGWLKAVRSGGIEKELWLKKFMQKNKGRWESSSNEPVGDSEKEDGAKITTRFMGRWVFQKHGYDKTNGLLLQYAVSPVKNAEVGIRAYWYGQGQVFVGWGMTDNDGYFNIATDLIPYGATYVSAFPLIYAWGPVRYDEKIKVSNPTSQTWKNPRDSTIWRLARSDGPPANSLVPGGTCNFGICYPETATASRKQPKSGAVNIYQTLLNGYNKLVPTYTSSTILTQIRAMWEPAYYPIGGMCSFYRRDSIFIMGDALSPVGTDEWDDMVLLHEYGHHVQNKCATIPIANPATWFRSNDMDKNASYTEGWPDLYSSIVTDSIYSISTLREIGYSYPSYYQNIENPWDFDDRINGVSSPDSFQGGPWCRGAVAGALWDMVDYNDEVPYPSYPVTGWPDVNLADSLDGGFWNIWNIFSKYKPYDYSSGGFIIRCQNIFHVMSGWDNNLIDSTGIYSGSGYGHPKALKQIATHHRIKPAPAAPSGITASTKNGVKITWRQNTEGGLYRYMVFRWNYSGMQTGYKFYRLTPATTDTFYTDTPPAGTNTYCVIAIDTNRTESEPSSWVTVTTAKGANEVVKSSRNELLSVNQNPATGEFMFRYQLANPGRTTIKIYNTLGQVVKTLVDQDRQPGIYSANWDGKDHQGRRAAAGVYLYRISAGLYNDVRKLVVVR